jgi:hypothetical protein
MNTCVDGPSFKVTKDITRKEYIDLCNQLSAVFGYSVIPLSNLGGGFLLNGETYKFMTFGMEDWPEIVNDPIWNWKKDNTILLHKDTKFNTNLHASRNTPKWTGQEVRTLIVFMCIKGIVSIDIPEEFR